MSESQGPWLDPEEAPTGLLLFAPEAPALTFADELATVLATGAVVAFVLDAALADRDEARRRCREQGVACLVQDDLELALALRADGVHLSEPAGVVEARRRLGPDAIIGADCGSSRHLAMVAGEDGADYVMFRAGSSRRDSASMLADLCRWWTGLFVLPCAVDLRDTDGDIGPFVRAGADFIAVREAVWNNAAGAAEAARDRHRRMDEARAQPQDLS